MFFYPVWLHPFYFLPPFLLSLLLIPSIFSHCSTQFLLLLAFLFSLLLHSFFFLITLLVYSFFFFLSSSFFCFIPSISHCSITLFFFLLSFLFFLLLHSFCVLIVLLNSFFFLSSSLSCFLPSYLPSIPLNSLLYSFFLSPYSISFFL